ncbi:MAG: hypothetical protein QNL91_06290 [Candidatus Krumholzibacteria bacterium]|nr:hypothetical protein [Candidatus Krumholzibacteria bacterium]
MNKRPFAKFGRSSFSISGVEMQYIEQLLYGHNHLEDDTGRQELGHSAGMGAEVSAEIVELCEAWGQPPELGLELPVLISHPLKTTMPSMRGRLFAIICVRATTTPLFHAVVVTDATFSGFGRNPFALARVVEFADKWNGNQSMDRVEFDPEIKVDLMGPAANAEDVGLVDEAVVQFIMTGKLELPLEQVVRQSDRALALVIACLPDKARKNLNFASFTTLQANNYDLAGVETEGASFAGWQRLMMARLDTGVTEQQQAYKDRIAEYLKRADLAGIARLSERHNFSAPTVVTPVVSTRQGTEGRAPVAPPANAFRPSSTINPAGRSPLGPAARGPGIRPMVATATTAGITARGGAYDAHGLDPAAEKPQPSRSQRPTRNRSRSGPGFTRGKRGAGGRFIRTISFVLLLFVAGWVGTMWLEGRTLTESLEWAGLPGMDGGSDNVEHAGTLLEVVDVGRVYEQARRQTGGKGFGLNASGDKGREKALGRLQSGATDPLLDQVALFVKLSDGGIQQSGRQDREVKRLRSLAQQGAVLQKEMIRLELAWYSLTTSVNWADLGTMSDAAITARRDSLAKVETGAIEDVRLGMGTEEIWPELIRAQRNMDGMAEVVALFQASGWSRAWEKKMVGAAEKISPSVGQTTRAYRNSAFVLIRLKRAERGDNKNLPFASRYQAEQWPTAQVKAVLSTLRKEAGRFSDKNAPELLGATLALYTTLEAPEKAIERISGSAGAWKKLQANAAVTFDPDLYGNFLERLRFEAAGRQIAASSDPGDIPAHLYQGQTRWSVAAFADSLPVLTQADQWQAMSTSADDAFLGRWADHLAGNMLARLAHVQSEFDEVWADCRAQSVAIQSQAKAGYDWSGSWNKLYTAAASAKEQYAATLGEDPVQLARFEYLDELAASLAAKRPLKIGRVTVRLDQVVLSEATEVQLELRTPERGGVWTSEPFLVGPSAPEGTGWVGTMLVDWTVPVSPRHQMTGRVVTVADQSALLEVTYPSLADGAGPAELVRPRTGEQGSLGFRVELEEYWSGLEIPALGPVF